MLFQYPLSDRAGRNRPAALLVRPLIYSFSILSRIERAVTVPERAVVVLTGLTFSILSRIERAVTVGS